MNIKVNKCPNCGNNTFGGFGAQPHVILTSAIKESNGSFTPDHNKVIGVIPLVCDECNYVLLFKDSN